MVYRVGAGHTKENLAKLMLRERAAVISKSTVGLRRLDFTGAELLVLIIFLLQNSNDCLQISNFLYFLLFTFFMKRARGLRCCIFRKLIRSIKS